MAYPTNVNSQITDAVTQTNVKVLGEAPAVALGEVFAKQIAAMQGNTQNATNAPQPPMVANIMGIYQIDTASGNNAISDAPLTPGDMPEAVRKALLGLREKE